MVPTLSGSVGAMNHPLQPSHREGVCFRHCPCWSTGQRLFPNAQTSAPGRMVVWLIQSLNMGAGWGGVRGRGGAGCVQL